MHSRLARNPVAARVLASVPLALALGLGFAPASAPAFAAGPERAPAPAAPDIGPRVDAFVRHRLELANVPGAAIAVLRGGVPLHVATYGEANVELGAPVLRDSVFELASLTKSFTAAAILLLRDEGKLALDDPISRFVDDVPDAWQGIELHHLLTHTAGLAHRFERTVDGELPMNTATASMLAAAKATPTIAQPGTDWEYSDQGYFLLGLAIERAAGMPYAEFLRRRFFEPLGMDRTRLLDQDAIVPGRVAGYRVVDGALRNIRRDWEFGLTSHFGILSTIDDLIAWERGLVEGAALSPELQAEWQSPVRPFRGDPQGDDVLAYGHGWWVERRGGRTVVSHSGLTGTSYLRALGPDGPLTAIVLTNRDQPSGPGSIGIAQGIAQIVDPSLWFEEALDGAPGESADAPPEPPEPPAPPAPPSPSAGPAATVEAFVDAFDRRDLDGMLARTDPEVRWMFVDGDAVAVETAGRDALRAAMEGYFAALPSSRSRLRSVRAAGPFVQTVEEATWEADGVRKRRCSPAVYELRDGRILHVWYFGDFECPPGP